VLRRSAGFSTPVTDLNNIALPIGSCATHPIARLDGGGRQEEHDAAVKKRGGRTAAAMDGSRSRCAKTGLMSNAKQASCRGATSTQVIVFSYLRLCCDDPNLDSLSRNRARRPTMGTASEGARVRRSSAAQRPAHAGRWRAAGERSTLLRNRDTSVPRLTRRRSFGAGPVIRRCRRRSTRLSQRAARSTSAR